MQNLRSILVTLVIVILSQFMGTNLYSQTKTIFGDDITANSQAQVDEFRTYAKTAMGDEYTPEYEQKLEAVLVKMKTLLDKTSLLDNALGTDLGPDEVNGLDDAIKEEGYDFTVKSLLEESDIIISTMESEILAPIKAKISRENDKEFVTLFSKASKGEKFKDKIENKLADKTFDEKLDALATSSKKLQAKLEDEIKTLKDAEYNFSKKVTTYVDNTSITMEEIDLLKANKRLVFAWDVLQYAQYKRYRAGLEAQYEEAISMGKTAETLSNLYKTSQLSKKDLTTANELTEALYTNSELRVKNFDAGVVPLWMKGVGGSFLNMYAAITIKDALHLATNGMAFRDGDPRKKAYQDKATQQKPVYKGGKLVEVPSKYVEFYNRVLLQYVTGGRVTLVTHTSTLAFVGSAELIRMFPASQLMNEYLGISKSLLSSTTGKIIRGVSGFGISMGIGAKMAEVVGDAVLRWEALFSDDKEIQNAAVSLFEYEHASTYSFKELGSFVTSFGAAEGVWWLASKGLSIPYKRYRLKALNRIACNKGKQRLLDMVINAATKTKWGRILLNQISTVALFFKADFIDSRFVRPLFISNKEMLDHDTKIKALTDTLMNAEFNAMTTDMVNVYSYYGDSYHEIRTIFNKYDDYMDLEPYVEIMKNNGDKVKTCLDMYKYDYVINDVPVKGPAMSYFCLQGFKDGSVDSFIAKYANNPAVRQKAREDLAKNDVVIEQEDLDKLKEKAKVLGEEQKKAVEYYDSKDAIPTAEELTLWHNKDKDYKAFIYAINDGKFTESKTYLGLAFDLEVPVVKPEVRTIIYKAVDDSFTYYSTIGKDVDPGVEALADLFLNIYPTVLDAGNIETYGQGGVRSDVLFDLAEAYYQKMSTMGYTEADLTEHLCNLRDAVEIAFNDYNDAFYLDDVISVKIKDNKAKLTGLANVYNQIAYRLDKWGYTPENCLQSKLNNNQKTSKDSD